ncbi:MAG: aromatic amino acid lyase [Bacteroidales bacterium]|nr:aromatic amino acid lyase [Bacteroidales bacterium]
MITFQQIEKLLYTDKSLKIGKDVIERMDKSYQFLEMFSRNKIIYGVNTGFGPMAQYRISDKDLNALQYNIVRSHSSGTGPSLKPIEVKAAMLARLYTFSLGYSGVQHQVVEQLITFINKGIYPYIPEHGSVGASGDLVQLAHLALTLIGEGEVFYKGQWQPTASVLQSEGIAPLRLQMRDGLALCNGTAVMTGIGFVNVRNARRLLHFAMLTSLLINEIASSYDDCFAEKLNNLKCHKGQQNVAATMRKMAEGSHCLRDRQQELYEQKHSEQIFDTKVQPYYSLRCVPQVLGPVWDTIANVQEVVVNEFNSVDDNPIVDIETGNVYHGGNFHGDYVSLEMDKLKIAVTKLTMLAERQLNYICHDRINGILPPFVNLGKLGLNYGIQAMQFTATSTTAESQTLSNPMYVHSIPNNNDNQDIVSMGTNSALIARKVIDNAFQVMAIYSIGLAQAVDCLQLNKKLSTETSAFYQNIRKIVPAFIDDTPKYQDIQNVYDWLKDSELNLTYQEL